MKYLKVIDEPVILFHHRPDPILKKVIEFSRDTNKVDWSHIPAIDHRLCPAGHGESVFVMEEVAAKIAKSIYSRFCI